MSIEFQYTLSMVTSAQPICAHEEETTVSWRPSLAITLTILKQSVCPFSADALGVFYLAILVSPLPVHHLC